MGALVKRVSPKQVSLLRRMLDFRKKKSQFNNPARDFRKVNLDELRKDLLRVFLNPDLSKEVRQKWANSHPQNLQIGVSLKEMVAERMNPKKINFWTTMPAKNLPIVLNATIESKIHVAESESGDIKKGRDFVSKVSYRVNKGIRKRIDYEFNQSVKRNRRNRIIFSDAVKKVAQANKEKSERILEIGGILIQAAASGDANLSLRGLSVSVPRMISGDSSVNEKMFKKGGIMEASRLENLTPAEVNGVAEAISEFAVNIARTEKTKTSEKQLFNDFTDAYMQFLVRRLTGPQNGKLIGN